jgi:hypothetical protein
MIELKVAAAYIRLYRDDLGMWVTRLGILKAIASNGGIAAWVVWREYAFLWAAIIAASQLADALKEVFPFTKTHKAASEHTVALNACSSTLNGSGKTFSLENTPTKIFPADDTS